MKYEFLMNLVFLIMLIIIIYQAWKLLEFKKYFKMLPKIKEESGNLPSERKINDQFFISDEARLIFILLYVESEERAKLLGITEEMYESIELAKLWKTKIVKIIHPDRCKHPQANEAMSKVNSIYARMKKYAE